MLLTPGDPYFVPRCDGRLVIGATREAAGWDPSLTWMGVPAAGSTFTGVDNIHRYVMPSSYAANNCLFLGGANYAFKDGDEVLLVPSIAGGR